MARKKQDEAPKTQRIRVKAGATAQRKGDDGWNQDVTFKRDIEVVATIKPYGFYTFVLNGHRYLLDYKHIEVLGD